MAVLPPVHHVVAVLVAGYCVGSVELGSVSVGQTLDVSNSELAVHRICDCLANTEKKLYYFLSQLSHLENPEVQISIFRVQIQVQISLPYGAYSTAGGHV